MAPLPCGAGGEHSCAHTRPLALDQVGEGQGALSLSLSLVWTDREAGLTPALGPVALCPPQSPVYSGGFTGGPLPWGVPGCAQDMGTPGWEAPLWRAVTAPAQPLPCTPYVCKHEARPGMGGGSRRPACGGGRRVPGGSRLAGPGARAPLQRACASASLERPRPSPPSSLQRLAQGPAWRTCSGGKSRSDGAMPEAWEGLRCGGSHPRGRLQAPGPRVLWPGAGACTHRAVRGRVSFPASQ